MSAIIEPDSAQWWTSISPMIRVSAAAEDHSVMLHRRYAHGGTDEIEIKLDELVEVEGALLNARLWLERAVKQRDELRAAEDVAQGGDVVEDDPTLKAATFIMSMLRPRP